VREAIAEVVGVAAGEDLRLGFQTTEGAGVDDAIPVALEIIAVGMLGLGEAASAGLRDLHRVRREHVRSLAKCRRMVPMRAHMTKILPLFLATSAALLRDLGGKSFGPLSTRRTAAESAKKSQSGDAPISDGK
jgi:hypothetical protein